MSFKNWKTVKLWHIVKIKEDINVKILKFYENCDFNVKIMKVCFSSKHNQWVCAVQFKIVRTVNRTDKDCPKFISLILFNC